MISEVNPDPSQHHISHRVLIEYKTAYIHYQVNKLFGTNHLPVHAEEAEENVDRHTIFHTAIEGGG